MHTPSEFDRSDTTHAPIQASSAGPHPHTYTQVDRTINRRHPNRSDSSRRHSPRLHSDHTTQRIMASHAPASGSEGDNRGELRARVYSAKALLVEGDTFPHRTKLKRMGGKWNRSLRGWIFSRRSRAGQIDDWLRDMGRPGVPADAFLPSNSASHTTQAKKRAPGPAKVKKEEPRASVSVVGAGGEGKPGVMVSVKEEVEEEGSGGGMDSPPRARKRLRQPKQEEEEEGSDGDVESPPRKVRTRLRRAKQQQESESSSTSSSASLSWQDGEDESSAWDGDSEEESYEGESDSEEEVWAEAVREDRGGGGRGKGKGKGRAVAARGTGKGIRVGDVADHILGRMGLGTAPKPKGSKAKAKKAASSSNGKKKKSKLGRGDETDFPELLPTVASKATAAAAAARRREGPSSAAAASSHSPLGRGGGMSAMAALPQEVLVLSVAGFLSQKELTQLHMTCKTFTLWLDDARAWANVPCLDLSYRSLAVRRSRSGRTSVKPMDMAILEVSRVVGQARFRLVQGVDLTGMELGSQRGTHGVAPLLKYVLDNLPSVKRLRIQGPGDSLFAWSRPGVYGAIAEDARVCAQLEELAVEVDRTTTAHLRALLARLPNLKTLILGGKHSVGFDPGDWARLLAPMETPLASVERVVVEEGPKLGPLAEFPGLFPSLFPGLSFLVLKKGNGDDIIFSWAPKGKD